MVGLLGWFALVVAVWLLPFGKIHSNIVSGKCERCRSVSSSYKFQSSLAWLAFSFFFFRYALPRQEEVQYSEVHSDVIYLVPHWTQIRMTFISGLRE